MTLIGVIDISVLRPARFNPVLLLRKAFFRSHGLPGQAPAIRSHLAVAFSTLVLAGCGLEARPIEGRSHLGPETARADTATGGEAAFADDGSETLLAQSATSDLPDSETLLAISRRAMADIMTTHRGFVPSIIAVTACYEALVSDDVEARIYCIQLDTAAWFIESLAPQEWQEMDAASNDYLTDARFYDRIWREAPPIGDTPDVEARKRANLLALEFAAGVAIREHLEALALRQPQKPAPQTPNFEELTWLR